MFNYMEITVSGGRETHFECLRSHKVLWDDVNGDVNSIFENDEIVLDGDTVEYKAQCHCGNIQETIKLPGGDGNKPLKAYICCCTICRQTYGGFGGFFVVLPKSLKLSSKQGTLENFDTPGTEPGEENRPFCGTCGARNSVETIRGCTIVDTSLWNADFWKFVGVMFSNSAKDNGLVPWLPKEAPLQALEFYNTHGDVTPEYVPVIGSNGWEERLRAECCCGGVSFTIPRPSQEVREEGNYLERFVAPSHGGRWKAYLDFSRETRLTSTSPFIPWMLVPRVELEPEVPSDLIFQTLQTYQSSEKITRGFCWACGSTVFLKSTDRCPSEANEVLGIAVGILKAPEGVRAENWVEWRAGKPYGDDEVGLGLGGDPVLTSHITENIKKWSLGKYGDYPEFDIM